MSMAIAMQVLELGLRPKFEKFMAQLKKQLEILATNNVNWILKDDFNSIKSICTGLKHTIYSKLSKTDAIMTVSQCTIHSNNLLANPCILS